MITTVLWKLGWSCALNTLPKAVDAATAAPCLRIVRRLGRWIMDLSISKPRYFQVQVTPGKNVALEDITQTQFPRLVGKISDRVSTSCIAATYYSKSRLLMFARVCNGFCGTRRAGAAGSRHKVRHGSSKSTHQSCASKQPAEEEIGAIGHDRRGSYCRAPIRNNPSQLNVRCVQSRRSV